MRRNDQRVGILTMINNVVNSLIYRLPLNHAIDFSFIGEIILKTILRFT